MLLGQGTSSEQNRLTNETVVYRTRKDIQMVSVNVRDMNTDVRRTQPVKFMASITFRRRAVYSQPDPVPPTNSVTRILRFLLFEKFQVQNRFIPRTILNDFANMITH